jgi:hypothetical protein
MYKIERVTVLMDITLDGAGRISATRAGTYAIAEKSK